MWNISDSLSTIILAFGTFGPSINVRFKIIQREALLKLKKYWDELNFKNINHHLLSIECYWWEYSTKMKYRGGCWRREGGLSVISSEIHEVMLESKWHYIMRYLFLSFYAVKTFWSVFAWSIVLRVPLKKVYFFFKISIIYLLRWVCSSRRRFHDVIRIRCRKAKGDYLPLDKKISRRSRDGWWVTSPVADVDRFFLHYFHYYYYCLNIIIVITTIEQK